MKIIAWQNDITKNVIMVPDDINPNDTGIMEYQQMCPPVVRYCKKWTRIGYELKLEPVT